MPSVSKRQQKMFGIALAIKRGKLPASKYPQAAKIAAEMDEKQLSEFAGEVKKKKKEEVKGTY